MSHRALTVFDAAAQAIEQHVSTQAHVYRHRALTLQARETELPAIVVMMGADEYAPDQRKAVYADYWPSRLTLEFIAQCVARNERDVLQEVLRLRTAVHVALMQDDTLGLAYVKMLLYDGAAAPEITIDNDRFVGRQISRWIVLYDLGLSNPA
ncbi:MAG: hypothetical protein RML32_04120 [Gammaproteobacteria bacterium]|nr:hypothetical protein [Gammaproteobacteria bacterium]